MASLKEIKSRITSVNSTMKITSAMKMVASAKLRKAQKNSEAFIPYQQKLESMLCNFRSSEENVTTPFAEQRKLEKVAIVVLSSNSSLCGAFNSNVIKELDKTLVSYKNLGKENILLFPIGKKVCDYCRKAGYDIQDLNYLIDSPQYAPTIEFADRLMNLFLEKQVDRIELIYQHSKSTSTQQLYHQCFLPMSLTVESLTKNAADYLVEPTKTLVLQDLLPKVLRLKIYVALLDSYAAEQAARTVAMQVATDNANDLLQELTIQYNKSRQQAITNELLDIIGGSQS